MATRAMPAITRFVHMNSIDGKLKNFNKSVLACDKRIKIPEPNGVKIRILQIIEHLRKFHKYKKRYDSFLHIFSY